MADDPFLPLLRPHPRNEGFTWRERDAAPRRLTREQQAHFESEGFVLVEDVFTAEEIAQVTAAIDPLEARAEASLRKAGGTVFIATAEVITFSVHLVPRSPVLTAFAAHPAIVDICHDLLADNVRLYWDQAVYKKTGEAREFPWHQDNGYTFIEPQKYLTFWLPLTDVDEANGCPWIAPGLHRLGTLAHRTTPIGLKCMDEAPRAVPVAAHAGDAIVFSSLSPHRTGPNRVAGSVRKAYILQYCEEGSIAWRDGAPVAQDDGRRQFKVLEAGRPVPAPPASPSAR